MIDYRRGMVCPIPELSIQPRPTLDYFNATSRAGHNPYYDEPGDPVGHKGIDLGGAKGSPILTSHPAAVTVHRAGYLNTGAGFGVELIEHSGTDGLWYMTRYLHFLEGSVLVAAGETVEPGSRIGSVGMTGNAHWYHTHFEIRVGNAKPYPGQSGTSWGTPLDPLAFGILGGPVLVTVTLELPELRLEPPPYIDRLAVRDLQALLNNRGAGLEVDGKLGPRTELAVVAFQTREGIPADGIVGAVTWSRLRSLR